jgi:hypothetical protein
MDDQQYDWGALAGGSPDDPPCPECGSTDTAPIHQEPMWASNDEPDPRVVDPPWYRCLACRHKWRADRAQS